MYTEAVLILSLSSTLITLKAPETFDKRNIFRQFKEVIIDLTQEVPKLMGEIKQELNETNAAELFKIHQENLKVDQVRLESLLSVIEIIAEDKDHIKLKVLNETLTEYYKMNEMANQTLQTINTNIDNINMKNLRIKEVWKA